MSYTYGAKGGAVAGKSAPGLPVPKHVSNSLSINVSPQFAADPVYINSTFDAASQADWSKVTNGAGIGSNTVSSIFYSSFDTDIAFGWGSSVVLDQFRKVDDNHFVALFVRSGSPYRVNFGLFRIGASIELVGSVLATEFTSSGGYAAIYPSSDPLTYLVVWKRYEDNFAQGDVFAVESGLGGVTTPRTGSYSWNTWGVLLASNSGFNATVIPMGPLSVNLDQEVWHIRSQNGTQVVVYSRISRSISTSTTKTASDRKVGSIFCDRSNPASPVTAAITLPPEGGVTEANYRYFAARPAYIRRWTSAAADAVVQDFTGLDSPISTGGSNWGTYYNHPCTPAYGYGPSGFVMMAEGSSTSDSFWYGDLGATGINPTGSGSTVDFVSLDPSGTLRVQGRSRHTVGQCTPVGPRAIAAMSNGNVMSNNYWAANWHSLRFLTLDEVGRVVARAVALGTTFCRSNTYQSNKLIPFGDKLLVLDRTPSDTQQTAAVWVYPR